MSIGDLFKRQHVEPAEIVTGRTVNQSVGEMSPEPEPGNVTNQKFGWATSLEDRAIPSKDFFTAEILLAEILDTLNKQRQSPTVGDFTHVRTTVVPATALGGTDYVFHLRDVSPYGYLFIPPHVESGDTATFFPVTIYKGIGGGDILIPRYDSQNYLAMAIPHMDDLSVVLTNTNATFSKTFSVWLSTRPIWVSSGMVGV